MSAPDHQLFTVLYTSRARPDFDETQLITLLAQSREANRAASITGMLLYRAGRFVQIIEGPEAAVEELLDRIRSDPRHSDVRIVLDERVEQRQFAEWSMGYERITVASEPAPAGYRDTFDDLDERNDLGTTARAARELSFWFRVRAGATGVVSPASPSSGR